LTTSTHAIGDEGRGIRVIGLIGVAHFLSHFFQLVTAPLFPLMRESLGVSYAQLGVLATVFYATSGICQAAAGFVVDRIGARRVLFSGIALLAGSVFLMGFVPSFYWLFPLAVLAGVGNSVFHPADFAVLNANVASKQLPHAYSAHGIAGNLGWACAPVVGVAIATAYDWRTALIVTGGAALLVMLLLLQQSSVFVDHRVKRVAKANSMATDVAGLMTAPILMCFAYFAFLAMTQIGLQTFSLPALQDLYGISARLSASAVTGFLIGGSVGILTGGFVANRVSRHDIVAAGGMLTGAGLTVLLAVAWFGNAFAVISIAALLGIAMGVTMPSRDMIVRAATPPGAAGKTYGFVYSGLDLGACATPYLFGLYLDHGKPQLIFYTVAVIMVVAVFSVLQVKRSTIAAAQVQAT
jgi:MFS family permease